MSNETSLITKNKKNRKLDGVNHCNEENNTIAQFKIIIPLTGV